jgi:predicted PurR-regulated permease PerM
MAAPTTSNWLRPFAVLICLFLAVVAMYFARMVVVPVVASALLTFVLAPLVNFLQRRGVHRIAAALVVSLLAFALIGGLLTVVAIQMRDLLAELPQHRDEIRARVEALHGAMSGNWVQDLSAMGEEIAQTLHLPSTAPQGLPPVFEWLFGSAVEFFIDAGLVMVLVVFMLIQREDLRNRLIRLTGPRHLTHTTKAMDDAARRVSRYLLAQVGVNACFGLIVGLGLWVIGVPYAPLWGLLGAALRYVPYIGTWLAAVCPVLLSIAVSQGWAQPLMTFGLFVLLDIVITNALEPVLYGNRIGVSGTALLIAAAFWTWLWGPIGLLLSTPLTACLVVLGRYVPHLEFLNVLLGDQPPLPTHVSFFQRLLARDEDEANELIEEHVQKHGVEEVYDKVLLPALGLAKENRERGELSEEDLEFILRGTRQVLEHVVFPEQEALLKAAAPEGAKAPGAAPAVRPLVLCCPARGEADEAALTMLQHLLPPDKCRVEVLSSDALAGEVLTKVEEERPAVLFIGALPPRSLSGLRYLCKRLRAQFPDLKVVVGCWRLEEDDAKRTVERLTAAGADAVAASLLEARRLLGPLVQTASHGKPPAKAPSADALQPVG